MYVPLTNREKYFLNNIVILPVTIGNNKNILHVSKRTSFNMNKTSSQRGKLSVLLSV